MIGAIVAFAGGGALAQTSEECSASGAPAEETGTEGCPDASEGSVPPEAQEAVTAFRRHGLTKIYYGMLYTDAPAAQIEETKAELDALGGPDPEVEPVDGPDNSAEWRDQVGLDRYNCEQGSAEACERLPESEASLEAAVESEEAR